MTRYWKLAVSLVTLATLVTGVRAGADEGTPRHTLPAAKSGGTVVGLCDGETSVEVKGLAPGKAMSRDKAQAVTTQLMLEWRKKHPEANWDDALAQAAAPSQPNTGNQPAAKPGANPGGNAPNAGHAGAPVQATELNHQAGTYENYDERDQLVWKMETQKFVDQGNGIFHDAQKLGGTIGVSCDMCHPNGANTHPETYPKFQVQLNRVAMLRDMINWCIENPVKGKPLADGDPKMKAMEAYLYAQRRGTKLEYGKH